MNALLASVTNPREADIALSAGADIIDCKNPADGALGALEPEMIRAIVEQVGGRKPVSATIGDLPGDAAQIRQGIERSACGGVDYIKFGLFNAQGAAELLKALKPTAARHKLIVVFFADVFLPDEALLQQLADNGFYGLMVDTADKQAPSLPQLCLSSQLKPIVRRAAGHGLFSGLAGRLALEHIPLMQSIGADYLGFRSALCGGQRNAAIDAAACAHVRALLSNAPPTTQVA